jgi:hypothetical protein
MEAMSHPENLNAKSIFVIESAVDAQVVCLPSPSLFPFFSSIRP